MAQVRIPWLILPLLGVIACGSDDDESPYEPDPPGQWLAGDMHVHATGASNDTGGDSHPADIAAMAKERGLYFVVLTDHSNSTGSDTTTTDEDPALFNQGPEFPFWDDVAELSEPGVFLMVDGNEISPVAVGEVPTDPRGHIGCIPEDLDAFDRSGAFIDRPRGDVSGGDALAQALDRGCFAIVNHPYSLPHMSFDWTGDGYHAMEVFNGTFGFDGTDLIAHDTWRCDLLNGLDITPIAASDNHRVNKPTPSFLNHPALGFPATGVFTDDDSWAGVMAGLRSGKVTMYEGDSRLYLDGYTADGLHAEGSDVRLLRVRGTLDPLGFEATVELTRASACDDPRPATSPPPTISQDVLLETVVAPGETFDVSATIGGEPGVYTAILRVPGESYWALSGAVVIR